MVAIEEIAKTKGRPFFWRQLAEPEDFLITLTLPEGRSAPAGGLNLSLVLVTDQFKGRSTTDILGEVVIEEGKSQGNLTFQGDLIFNPSGFTMAWSRYHLAVVGEGADYDFYDRSQKMGFQWGRMTPIVHWLDQQKYHIEMKEMVVLTVTLQLEGEDIGIYEGLTRAVHLEAKDLESERTYTEEVYVPVGQKEVDHQIRLPKGGTYTFTTHAAVIGGFPYGNPMPPSPVYPSVQWTGLDGEPLIVHLVEEEAIGQVITVETISLGPVHVAKDQLSLNGEPILTLVVNGHLFVSTAHKGLPFSGRSINQALNPEQDYLVKPADQPVETYAMDPLGTLVRTNVQYRMQETNVPVMVYDLLFDDDRDSLVLVSVEDLKAKGVDLSPSQ